jgi:hypothetical protein
MDTFKVLTVSFFYEYIDMHKRRIADHSSAAGGLL